jgi:cell division protein FtsW (lipid II flippase)
MTLEEYLSELGGQIRDDQARSFVEDEVRCHIMDQAEAYESDGMVREDALITAVREMGDPVSVGIDLDKIHRPHMDWRFLVYVFFISILNLGIQYLINRYMPLESDGSVVTHFSGTSTITTFVGLSTMLVMYRLDYTILAGRSRIAGLAYLIIIAILSGLCESYVNGGKTWISIDDLSVSSFALMTAFLPLFAGILYDYRGKGKSAIVKILLWMFVPVSVGRCCCRLISTSAIFILSAETILFILALYKGWYTVNIKAVLLGGVGITIILAAARLMLAAEYQKQRIMYWLAHFGIGNYSANADHTINYVCRQLTNVFAHSNVVRKSDEAIAIMKELPSFQGDLVLGSVAATCGIIAAISLLVCLLVLSVYIFSISLRQRNALGYIIGCSCGVAIGLQSFANILAVFGILPFMFTFLPFFGGGFSTIVVDYALLGLVLSIYRYKDIRKEKTVKTTVFKKTEIM